MYDKGFELVFEINSQYSKVALLGDEDTITAARSYLKIKPNLFDHKESLLKGIGTKKHNHAFWLIEDTMKMLIQAGIPQWYRKFIYEVLFRDFPSEEIIPKVFSIHDLEFGFVIWAVACGISFVCFFMECIYFYVRKTIEEFSGLYGLLKGLKMN